MATISPLDKQNIQKAFTLFADKLVESKDPMMFFMACSSMANLIMLFWVVQKHQEQQRFQEKVLVALRELRDERQAGQHP
ncbi:hypothetical protein PCANC_01940 [Puccinia coronata f. sp. avenae]|uniref:Uncharacterized protein n=1 Tax=Puccinia coronata f. sp. avenae TaxID=200324 RepID=A0A2N5SY64_9BASI|nr:hypothetical protein PCANC_12680 [Puccinia coronata f. sp. avenae]PLW51841.1 hypothetical protein PCASD_00840 [Puccinia coronata f. sp. avenae]PLW57128.1 hypothetical protein PCANC_01940 [Puccinia coronata f. sp. avenae]